MNTSGRCGCGLRTAKQCTNFRMSKTRNFHSNESEGESDYLNASGNSNVFDSQSGLSGMEGRFVLVPRGHCTFEAKARSGT